MERRLPNGLGVAQGIESAFPQRWPGADVGHAGAAELLVEVAVGTGARGGDWQRRPLALVWQFINYFNYMGLVGFGHNCYANYFEERRGLVCAFLSRFAQFRLLTGF
jgi:hypothetical protein